MIWLNGLDCIHAWHYWEECTSETYEYYLPVYDEEGNYVDDDGPYYETTSPGCGAIRNEKWEVTYYPVTVHLDGFALNDETEFSYIDENTTTYYNTNFSRKTWETPTGMKITDISDDYFDEGKGTHYGIITVSCDCCQGGCQEQFVVYFGPDGPIGEEKILTVKINPPNSGAATVTGLFWSDTQSKYIKSGKTVQNSGKLKVLPGTDYEIVPVASGSYDYVNMTESGKELTRNSPYVFRMPNENMTLTVNFERNYKDYTLYVTSNEGGKAWTDYRPEGTTYEPYIYEGKNLGDKISNVRANTEFQLKEKAEDGYNFSRYEYRPFVNDNDIGKFLMPHSDLTATGIFKKSTKTVSAKPKLTVVSNNPAWGTAYAELDGSRLSNPSEVDKGKTCEIKFEASPGYYFTNWEYDSEESPFINRDNKIKMPNYDLKIIAFFAPIPEQDEFGNGKNVEFVAEAIDADDNIMPGKIPGIVPQNLTNIKKNANVTFGVTANTGYKFVKWYFTDKDNNIIYPSNSWTDYGSGYFSMPEEDVIAHAVFRRTVTLTIRIKGSGYVNLRNQSVGDGFRTTLVEGSKVNLSGEANTDYKFTYWEFNDGSPNNTNKDLKNYVVNNDITITANFVKKGYHTLYVTYTQGGTAEPTKYPSGKTKEDFYLDKEKIGYKIENLKEGQTVTINYAVNGGYSFKKWEYNPYIISEETGIITKITMPDSDLTVTAIFEAIPTADKPKLKVTSNNPDWGTAKTKDDKGNYTNMKKETGNVTIGNDYPLEYEAKAGYYFIKWQYSTEVSPFIDTDTIRMPDKNLEVMAIFAPIPEIQDTKHSIDFTPVPPEGGSVPQDLAEVSPGGRVTIGVTPNIGWKFVNWVFKDKSGRIITYKIEKYWEQDGSGYFIMPDYDVIAEAHFERTTYKLYVTHTPGGDAWTYDGYGKNPNTPTVCIDALPGYTYIIYGNPETGYSYDGIGVSCDGGDNPVLNGNIITMPHADTTVTVKFKQNARKIRVISNNYLWGDAWLEVQGDNNYFWGGLETGPNPNNNPGIDINKSKKYIVHFEPREGYLYRTIEPPNYVIDDIVWTGFGGGWDSAAIAAMSEEDRWKAQAAAQGAAEQAKAQYTARLNQRARNGGQMNVKLPETINSDITIIVYFEKAQTTLNNLTVKASPDMLTNNDNVWIDYIDRNCDCSKVLSKSLSTGESFKVHATDQIVKYTNRKGEESYWKFSHWNMRERWPKEPEPIIPSGTPWGEMMTAIAAYQASLLKDDAYEYGELIEGVSYENEYTGTMGDKNLVMYAVFIEDDPPPPPLLVYYDLHVIIKGNGKVVDKNGEIVTTRRLLDGTKIELKATPYGGSEFSHWEVEGRDYGGNPREFKIKGKDLYVTVWLPDVIKKDEEIPNRLKIISVRDLRWKDYFVDNKGKLTGLEYPAPLTDSIMLRKPDGASKEIDILKMGYAVEFEFETSNVPTDDAVLVITPVLVQNGREISLNSVKDYMSGNGVDLDSSFKKIVINGDNSDNGYKTKYQTLATPIEASNNGVSLDKIKWNWVYYLPADIWFSGATKDPITVRFDINLRRKNGKYAENFITFEHEYRHSNWQGDVYRYSMKESLLDDIYNNATN